MPRRRVPRHIYHHHKMRYFFLFIAIALTISTKAEIALVAILSHGDQITTFQSSNAFAQAVAAAENGDVITLSSGSFTATDITKNLIIRGAGMMPSQNPTIISGDFNIKIDTSAPGDLSFEGIYNNNRILLYKANIITFLKCNLNSIGYDYTYKDGVVNDIKILQCFIQEFRNNTNGGNIVNSYVKDFDNGTSTVNATNCIIRSSKNTNFRNCIITLAPSAATSDGDSSSTYSYCISNRCNFRYSPTGKNECHTEIENFFKEGTDCYELKDEYATRFLGSDGTQVGIHGGALPFDPITTSLKIKKFSVASRTTADGKLPIEIEIDGN